MRMAIGVALATLFLATGAAAERQLGIEVYPGAKADKETAAQLKKAMSIDASTYRTSDSVEKVTDFYRKQGLKEMPGADKKGSAFSGKGVNVTIQNPWMDMKTGKLNNDTLVSIVKR